MRVLLIGGSGFIGSHVADALLASGVNVTVFDRSEERYRRKPPGLTYIRGELGNRGELESTLASGMDAVVHLVSSTTPKTSNDDPIFDVQMNLVESIALLDSCVKHRVKKLVFISSGGTVYGVPQELPIPETHPTNPICSYGIVKLAIEKYIQLYNALHGLQFVILRVSNPYGIRQDPFAAQGVISVFMGELLRGLPLEIWGDGTVVRDFVHIHDVAQLCRKALFQDVQGIFNAGSGSGTSLRQLLEVMALQLRMTPEIQWKQPRAFDVPAVVLNVRKAEEVLGWRPYVTMEEGFQELAEWQKSCFNGDFSSKRSFSAKLATQR